MNDYVFETPAGAPDWTTGLGGRQREAWKAGDEKLVEVNVSGIRRLVPTWAASRVRAK